MAEKMEFTPEQKASILEQAEKNGAKFAANKYGITTQTIGAWKRAAKQEQKQEKKAEVKAKGKKAEEKAKETAVATKIEAKKTASKAKRTVKKAAAEVKEAAKAPAKKAKAAKLNIVIQSPYGGNITPEEIAAKIPEGADAVFVRVDQNKLWWVKDDETGSVEIW